MAGKWADFWESQADSIEDGVTQWRQMTDEQGCVTQRIDSLDTVPNQRGKGPRGDRYRGSTVVDIHGGSNANKHLQELGRVVARFLVTGESVRVGVRHDDKGDFLEFLRSQATMDPKEAVSDLWYCFVHIRLPPGSATVGEDLRSAGEDFIYLMNAIGVDLWKDFAIDEEWLVGDWHRREREGAEGYNPFDSDDDDDDEGYPHEKDDD